MQDFYSLVERLGVVDRVKSFETSIYREVRQRLTDAVRKAMGTEPSDEDDDADSLALFRNKECVDILSNRIPTLVNRVLYACAVTNDTAEEGMITGVSYNMAEPLGYLLPEFSWQSSDRYGGEVTEWIYCGSGSIIGIYMDWLDDLQGEIGEWVFNYFKENPLVCSDGVHNIESELGDWTTFLHYATTVLTEYALSLSRFNKEGYYEITNYVPYDRVAVRYFLKIIKDVLDVKVYYQEDKYNTFDVGTCARYYIECETNEWLEEDDDEEAPENYFTKFTLNLTELDGEWYEWECEYSCQDFYLLVRNGSDTDKNFDTIRESDRHLRRRYPADMTTTL